MQKKLHIKKGDNVMVIAGEFKGKEGKVISVDRDKLRAKISGLNLVKKHTKPSAKSPQGGIVEEEAGIHVSNLMLMAGGKPTRIGRKEEGGKTVRYSKKTKEVIK
jgi:large subunit ribosomal protein L24